MSKRPKLTSEQSNKRIRGDGDSTQELIASSSGSTKKKEAQVGIIESISLTNFMCHSNLNFEFGANVNFVIGKNGSGKSAVLTGLVVGLGGKANVTSRGSNLKTFIKEGKTFATVTVMLRNKGVDAYKPQEFGEFIIVERRISLDGASSYKIKGQRGNLVSNKKDELVRILDQFNIQVENPVAVLNQETSRNFLNSKSPKDKYLFFLKATQLEQIKEEYSNALEQKGKIKDTLSQKMSTLQVLEKEVQEWERKWEAHQCLEEQRTKVSVLRGELVWALVNEREKEVQQNLANVKNKSEILPKLEEQIKKIKEKENAKKEKLDCIQQKLNEIKQSICDLRPQCTEAKETLDQQKTAFRTRELELRKLKSDESAGAIDENSLLEHIKKMRNSEITDVVAAERMKRENDLKLLDERKASLIASYRTTEMHLEQLNGSIQQYQDDLQSLQHEKVALVRQADTLERTLRNLEASRTDRYKRFGQNIPELLKKIERQQFRQKPRGPIGAHISLVDDSWALAIETCLGPLLYSFCCDNHNDEKILIRLINETIRDGSKPSIIVSQFQKKIYDVSRFRVHAPPHHTIFDTLKIEDGVIANCLIDQRNIESVLLIAESRDARQIMMRQPPQNCQIAFTKAGDRLHAKPFRYYSSQRQRANILQGSAEEKIQEIQSELQMCNERKKKLFATVQEAESILFKNQQELKSTESRKLSMRHEIARLDNQINELQNVEEPEIVDVTELEEELQTKKEDLLKLRSEITKMKEIIAQMKERTSSVQENYDSYVSQLRDIKGRSEPLKIELQSTDTELQTLQHQHSKAEANLKEQKSISQEVQEEYENSLKDLDTMKTKAEKINSSRIDTRRPSSAIQNEIDKIKRQLQCAEKTQGNVAEVLNNYTETKENYEKIKNMITGYNEAYKTLDKSLSVRRVRYAQFRSQLTVRVKLLFFTSLSQRQYKGKMVFDHKRGILELQVQPRENVKDLTEDTRSLSGGERSFSTVCFILALWDAMESPFRILDEFDVFMDMINRRISMDMMLDTAMHKRQNQFIFLTPQDMTKIRASDLVKICKMPDPIRAANQLASNTEDRDDA